MADSTPVVTLDLDAASDSAFQDVVQKLKDWIKANPPTGPFPLGSGWHDVTPEIAKELLRRNHGNRKLSFKTVKKYADTMKRGEWQPTGQTILVNQKGQMDDGQHRAWACLLTGHSFRSYIVCDVPEIPRIFAYIDDSKPRSMGDAIYTAGSNGLGSVLAAAVKLAWRYDNFALDAFKSSKLREITNIEALDFVEAHPDLGEVAHRVSGNYTKAITVIGNKAVAIFAAWKIATIHGDDVLDDFFVPLGSGANLEEGSVILGLRNRLMGEADDKLRPAHRLALIIKAFNLFISGTPMGKKGIYLRDNDKYPRFDDKPVLADAAE